MELALTGFFVTVVVLFMYGAMMLNEGCYSTIIAEALGIRAG